MIRREEFDFTLSLSLKARHILLLNPHLLVVLRRSVKTPKVVLALDGRRTTGGVLTSDIGCIKISAMRLLLVLFLFVYPAHQI